MYDQRSGDATNGPSGQVDRKVGPEKDTSSVEFSECGDTKVEGRTNLVSKPECSLNVTVCKGVTLPCENISHPPVVGIPLEEESD